MARRRHWSYLVKLIKERNLHIIAEIGVYTSRSTSHILDPSYAGELIETYWAIDPWLAVSTTEHADAYLNEISQSRMDSYYWWACAHMVANPQLRVVRLPSLEAVELFKDGFFDLVYIDALHQYKHVIADIRAWLPKVRNGGILSGHDYGYPDVTRAVHEVIGKKNIKEGWCTVWYMEI